MDVISKYCKLAEKRGATGAKGIHPGSVVTAPWVRFKCQFGCPKYDQGHLCPPDTPTPEQTRAMLDSYQRAILFRIEVPKTPERKKTFVNFFKMVVDMEGELFKDGYYKAFAFLSGPCQLCKECGKLKVQPCQLGDRARPSMEGCGIDVFQTARNGGFFIKTLSELAETQNNYSLLMVD